MALSRAAVRCYDALGAIEAENGGWPVPVRVVQRALGVASPSTAHAMLHSLERHGLAERSPYPKAGGWRTRQGRRG